MYCRTVRFPAPFKSPGHRLNMELDLLSLFGLQCTAILIGWDPVTPPPPHPPQIWAHMQGRYWSAKIDDISLNSLPLRHRAIQRLPVPEACPDLLYQMELPNFIWNGRYSCLRINDHVVSYVPDFQTKPADSQPTRRVLICRFKNGGGLR